MSAVFIGSHLGPSLISLDHLLFTACHHGDCENICGSSHIGGQKGDLLVQQSRWLYGISRDGWFWSLHYELDNYLYICLCLNLLWTPIFFLCNNNYGLLLQAGGTVSSNGRLQGRLEVSRAFGDRQFKKVFNLSFWTIYFVVSCPAKGLSPDTFSC